MVSWILCDTLTRYGYKDYNRIIGKKLTHYTRRTWAGAAAYCQENTPVGSTGWLATAESPEKADFVTRLVYDPAGSNKAWQWVPCWIGGRRTAGVWHWTSSSGITDAPEFVWSNWQPEEGTGGNNGFISENCMSP